MFFPVIKTLDDVLPIIKDKKEFSVNFKDGYTVVDYQISTPDLFNNPIEKECRGLIFDADGKILSRRYHKFFNFGERPESSIENIDFSKKHWILEKLDGSLISPLRINDNLIWGSMAGETFLSPQVAEFVKQNPSYIHFADRFIDAGETPIFEWCTRKNRIVLDYPEDRLVLTGIRRNEYGDYCPYDQLVGWANIYNIDFVKPYNVDWSMEALADWVRRERGIEGYVIVFEDGQRIKIKCDEYVRYHTAKDSINLEKNVISIIVNGQADDFKQLLSNEDRNRFEDFEADFWYWMELSAREFDKQRSEIIKSGVSRKEFAIQSKAYYDPFLRSIIFDLFDDGYVGDHVILKYIIDYLKKNCNTATQVNSARRLFNNITWYDY